MDSVFMKNEKISNLIDSDNVEGWENSNTSTVELENKLKDIFEHVGGAKRRRRRKVSVKDDKKKKKKKKKKF